jgi:hypothetical protein
VISARPARSAACAPGVVETTDDPRTSDLVAALARLTGDDSVIVLVDGPPRTLPPGVALHPAPSLDAHGVAALAQAMLGQAVPRTWAAALHAASSGQPLSVIELVSSVADDRDPFAIDWSARSSITTIEHRAKQSRRSLRGAPRDHRHAWRPRAVDRVLPFARVRAIADKQDGT